ncbi:hypothetical protein M6D93_12150 [Jatrophihabitans telluris]|uniref:Uncharacterized protein n=1 Tax=Jatrophihabitans telluris TaxID=2038343 RepID=A0ABY4QVB4_9ACTN|nr:hypothetical protein [Jatrophihabitans telluris]UQX87057.1 hypothetical protein M6D93_12150 [Jatrophihabitans telluris]
MTTDELRTRGSIIGLLSGTGADLVRATVITQAVPDRPPLQLNELVAPVYDHAAHLIDWRLTPHHPDQKIEDAEISAFRSWRASFTAERLLGERALIRAFLDWTPPQCDTRALDVLRLPSAHVDFHTALEMRLQIDQARKIVNASTEHGYGLFTAAGRRSASRALIPTDPPTVLLATAEAALTIGPGGLRLQQTAADNDTVRLRGWTAHADGIRAQTSTGEIYLAESAAARLLRAAGRHADDVEVHECPLSTLLAPLLVFLRDATELAGNTGAALHIRSGWS